MPMILLERLPLPSLRTYTTFSVFMLTCALFYSHQIVTDVAEYLEDEAEERRNRGNGTVSNITTTEGQNASVDDPPEIHQITFEDEGYGMQIATVLLSEAWCVWTLINIAYCGLIMVGKAIQKIVFGELRVSEQQNLRDKFWNFVFYKFIFIFGVMNVQNMDEVVLWCAWFSVLGFLHLLAQLSKDRFEYLSFSPTTPTLTHTKVLMLLGAIQTTCCLLMVVCLVVGYVYAEINTFAFMLAEVLLLSLKTMYVITRYGIHLWDLHHDGVWENRAGYVYYSELVFELIVIAIDFIHHLHMLVWGNIFLSMASLVICMQLRYLFYEFQRRLARHKNYLRVVKSMEATFMMATQDELDHNNDDCAICWEKMDAARKLPCNHLFHNACLRSWLEQDTSCPTCRMSLSDLERVVRADRREQQLAAGDGPPGGVLRDPPINQPLTNHFFHFDGSRYVSWLPSFSVEVTHTQLLGHRARNQAYVNSQLDNMVRQVQEVFPGMPPAVILEDLRLTHSVEVTIENIIEGRLTAPPNFSARSSQDSDQDTESGSNSDTSESGAATTASSSDGAWTDANEQNAGVTSSSPMGADAFSFSGGSDSAEGSAAPRGPTQQTPATEYEDFPTVIGGRFSKSPTERESMLEGRKLALLQQAQRRFKGRESGRPEAQQARGQEGEEATHPASTEGRYASPLSSLSQRDPAARQDDLHRRTSAML